VLQLTTVQPVKERNSTVLPAECGPLRSNDDELSVNK